MKMRKQLSIFAVLMLLLPNYASAAEKTETEKKNRTEPREKVVTAAASLYSGNAVIIDHYLSDQEYTGPVLGGTLEFGAMYKRSETLSWDLDLTYLGRGYSQSTLIQNISNPAGTSAYKINRFNADYGTYYNWNPAKNLYIKAGGNLDILFGMLYGVPDHVNNKVSTDFQTQIKAGAGIKYGWNFKKCGLALQANVEVPFIGFALSGTRFSSSVDSIIGAGILGGSANPFCFTSLHNLTGYNADIEAELIIRKTTIFLAYESNLRTWNIHDVQNVRKFNMTRIGLRVDLATFSRLNSTNRFF
jgi:hypothetical protein